MKERLVLFGLQEKDVPGDGNCQFYAIADQLRQKQLADLNHEGVRAAVVEWLRTVGPEILVEQDPDITLAEVSGEPDWGGYCRRMEVDKQWGDHLTLLTASMQFQVEILLISSSETDWGCVLECSGLWELCLLYTSDAADEEDSVDLGGRRIIKKKKKRDKRSKGDRTKQK
eukprot:TRINITY_DN56687_c0_g1_i1.p3 TRINITY_DN56687_c0_g1~~TRINITY_DN56687_c0_g1_i1.p3  ORF type:complete len:171 (-),score=49.99 TRINITY_DN56687_c0_g1_i1:89-601(-)